MNMFTGRRTVVVLLVVASSMGAAPTTAGASPLDRRCTAPAATNAALHDLTEIPGIVGVAVELSGPRCGRWAGTSGVADVRTGRPMAAGERVRIGSTTKTFTATVVLQLAAEGRVGLDRPVERYLPGVVRGNGYEITHRVIRPLWLHGTYWPGDSPYIRGPIRRVTRTAWT